MTTQVKPSPSGGGATTTVTGLYGNGGDGVLTVVGTYTANTERQWQTLTIPSGGVYKPAGYRTFVRGTCTIDAGGSFNDDGNSGASGGAYRPDDVLALRRPRTGGGTHERKNGDSRDMVVMLASSARMR